MDNAQTANGFVEGLKLALDVPLIPLARDFYDRSPAIVAEQLLGKAIVRKTDNQLLGGLIVETEAYLSADDPASHSFRGSSKRNRSMFAQAGTLYVYTIHAKYCLNAVTEAEGVGSAVLVRAIEPVWSIDRLRENRGKEDLRQLCRGPAMLCQAMQVDLKDDGLDLCDGGALWIADAGIDVQTSVLRSGRIGISQGTEMLLRFFVDGNRYVSGRVSEHRLPVRGSLL